MTHRAIFTDRSGTTVLPIPQLAVSVLYYDHFANGGPNAAEIEITGPTDALYSLADYLGYRVDIINENADRVWFGFVNDVSVGGDGWSLDGLTNRGRGRYDTTDPDDANRPLTDWYENTRSIAEYGIKERIFNLDGVINTAAANAVVQREVADAGTPLPLKPTGAQVGAARLATINCLGFVYKLGWRYIPESTGIEGHPDDTQDTIPIGNNVAANSQHHQSWTVQGATYSTNTVWIRIQRSSNAPTFNLTMNVRIDAGGTPGGIGGSATITPAMVGEEMDWVEVTFTPGGTFNSGAVYWLEFLATGSHPNRHYWLGIDQSGGYEYGGFYAETGFIDTGWDMGFAFYDTIDTAVWAADIIRDYGPFNTVTLVEPSGFVDIRYVNRDQPALQKAAALLDLGTSDGKYYFARVTPQLDLIIVAIGPDDPDYYLIRGDNQLFTLAGYKVPASLAPLYAGSFMVRGDMSAVVEGVDVRSRAFIARIAWRRGDLTFYPFDVGFGGRYSK